MMLLFALALAADVPRVDEDAPHRIAIERLALTGDHIEIGSCTTRLLGRSAKVQNYPVRDGVGIDWTPKSGLFMSAGGDPILAFEFKRDDAGPYLKLLYRHPYNAEFSRGFARKAAKTCFKGDWNAWAPSIGEKIIKDD